MSGHWTETEVEAAVADYFDMLKLELQDRKYNKSEHRRLLKSYLNARTDRSIESKHQNISAVLIEMGIPYIDGYKPLYNYQRSLLPRVIINFLKQHPELQQLFAADLERMPKVTTVDNYLATLEPPPLPEPSAQSLKIGDVQPIYNPAGINYVEREAQNSLLGEAGEQFVIAFEKQRLLQAGKESLAERIEQVSFTRGPSAGFDVLSFEVDGTDRYIEAKTTKYGKSTPFFITPHELRFSHKNSARYFIYRVFKFRASPRLFSLRGRIEDQCVVTPSEYMVKPG